MNKPIWVTFDQGVDVVIREATMQGVRKVIQLARKRNPVENMGEWYAHAGSFGSIKWYIKETFDYNRKQIRADKLLNLFQQEPWQEDIPHYDIQITSWDLTCANPDGNSLLNFCLGCTRPGLGIVLSGFRFKSFNTIIQKELMITLTMHEVAHMFGLISRNFEVTRELGMHCVNNGCLMRQGMKTEDWLRMTDDRLSGVEFCQTCLRELRD